MPTRRSSVAVGTSFFSRIGQDGDDANATARIVQSPTDLFSGKKRRHVTRPKVAPRCLITEITIPQGSSIPIRLSIMRQDVAERPHSVLIPISNPELAPQYIRLGARFAKKHDSEIVLLYVALPSSDQTPDASTGPSRQPEQVLEEARSSAESLGVPVKTMVRDAHSVAEGIVFVADDPHIDYLIMGWRGDVQGGKTVIGSEIDGVVRESNCHAVVMQQGPLTEDERILVPAANPSTAPLSLAVACLLRGDGGPKVTVLHLAPVASSDAQKESFQSALLAVVDEARKGPDALSIESTQFEIAFDVQDDPSRELAEQSKEYDRMIVGTSQDGSSRAEVFGKLPLQIAKEAACPVVFVRPKRPY